MKRFGDLVGRALVHHRKTILAAYSLVALLALWHVVGFALDVVSFAATPRIGIAYASKRDQNRKWRFTLSCRADTPKRLLEKWSAPNRKPCSAGKTFGVIGPNGLYRTCLHALPERSRFERLMNMRKAQR